MKYLPKLIVNSLLIAGVFCLLFFMCFSIYTFVQIRTLGNRIYPNVYIDTVNFGRMTTDSLKQYVDKKNNLIHTLTITTTYKDGNVATFSAEMLGLHFDQDTVVKQAFSIGRSPLFFSSLYQQIKSIFNLGTFNFETSLSMDTGPFKDYLGNLEDSYNLPPQNALFKYENGKVTAFKIETYGLKIKSDVAMNSFIKTIKEGISQKNYSLSLNVPDEKVPPDITLASANNFGITEEIASGTSDYSGSSSERIHNVLLAASKFNGVLIQKNDEFSFDKTIGDISSSTGYVQAYIIQNGKTVLGDGGGVCQVSTTLFRAALHAGLPITERNAHAYRVHYYENDSPPGFDATVFSPTVDFKFLNDTPSPILIQTQVDKEKNILTFILYGKKDDRQVEITNTKLYGVVAAPDPLYQDDPTLKVGVTKQIDFAAGGAKASFHYKVIKAGKITSDQDFFSDYRPWRAVFLVGTQG